MGNLLASFGVTRDSGAWIIGKASGLILAAAGIIASGGSLPGIPASWSPYVLLAAFIVGGGSAHYGNSPLPGKHDGSTINVATFNAKR